ncbi:hypothetical protein [Rosenbergiella collisarenosi]|uniref:hypothetical protein n=1 Tax=Rosenbergiella collisarenosi TaxID=1544695 RepID=UPI001F4E7605|nr:hypothetical protein [Rosenbergiella collisarenosi]
MSRIKDPYPKQEMAIINKLVAGFLEWNGLRLVITARHVKQYIREVKAKEKYVVLVINHMIRINLAAKQGRPESNKPTYIMVGNLPVKISWTLSKEATSRLIGSSLSHSAVMGRLIHQAAKTAEAGSIYVQ